MKTYHCKPLFILLICMGTNSVVFAQEGYVNIIQDSRITTLLNLKKTFHKNDDIEKRHRIQIYHGSLKDARNVIKDFKRIFPEWFADIKFETPNYKVWVGKYRTRLEAERYLVTIKEKYPGAIILNPK